MLAIKGNFFHLSIITFSITVLSLDELDMTCSIFVEKSMPIYSSCKFKAAFLSLFFMGVKWIGWVKFGKLKYLLQNLLMSRCDEHWVISQSYFTQSPRFLFLYLSSPFFPIAAKAERMDASNNTQISSEWSNRSLQQNWFNYDNKNLIVVSLAMFFRDYKHSFYFKRVLLRS